MQRLPPWVAELGDLLRDWLPEQRWYAGKGRPLHQVEVISSTTLRAGEPHLEHLLLAVDHGDARDRYQVLVGLRTDLPERLGHALLGRVGDGADERDAYVATYDPELMAVLLALLATGDAVGPLTCHRLDPATPLEAGLTSRLVTAEQSNTSLVFGQDYILKLFRRIASGINPDLELTRVLAEAGSDLVAPPLAWLEETLDETPTTLGILQPFLRTGSAGWALAVTSVRDLYAEGDLHAGEVGGDFAGEAARLGAATARVHRDLARALPTSTLPVGEFDGLITSMTARLEAAVRVVPPLGDYAERVRACFDEVRDHARPIALQRIHGDLHLGQVLRTDTGWVLLDFEGEPVRTLTERRSPRSPLRDVAGMLRSFDYAAWHLLVDVPARRQLEYRAAEWAQRNRNAFCDGYARDAGHDPRADVVLLRAFELDKAVYEVEYEARHRPGWLSIPLGSVQRLVAPQ